MSRDGHGDSLEYLPRADAEALAIVADPVAYRQRLARDVEALAESARVPAEVMPRENYTGGADISGPTPARVPEWVQDPAKWRSMTRAERRAVERHHRRRTR